MYPHGDLTWIETRRAQVRDRIDLRRRLAALQLEQLATPVRRLDHAWQTWRRVAPTVAIAAVPVALFAGRRFRALRWVGRLLRLAPVVFAVTKAARAAPSR